MFGRKKTEEQPAPEPVAHREGAKNRPTPTRREREEARKRPVVPVDRKAAAKANRDRMRTERDQQRTALLNGDESGLGPRDAGPIRRFVRDVVDARWNVGEFYLALAFVAIILVLGPQLLGMSLQQSAQIQLLSTAVLWAMILGVLVDSYLLNRRIKRMMRERFGEEVPTRGHVAYGVTRALQIRRWRLPRPAVARGEAPRP